MNKPCIVQKTFTASDGTKVSCYFKQFLPRTDEGTPARYTLVPHLAHVFKSRKEAKAFINRAKKQSAKGSYKILALDELYAEIAAKREEKEQDEKED